VTLTVQAAGSDEQRTVSVAPRPADDWYLPTTRGIQLRGLSVTRKADNVASALAMGWSHTKTSMMTIYLTLRSLVTGLLSFRELHGPLGILQVAHDVAAVGIVPFILFLGLLSINLAVLNFLPIPVLDGGHMVFLVWEAATRRKPNERVVIAATWMGMMFILGLMVTVLYLDITRMFGGGS
jgi:regulator of sigma E protease